MGDNSDIIDCEDKGNLPKKKIKRKQSAKLEYLA